MPDIAYTFSELIPEHQSLAGGKGGTLSRLYQAGYPVPDGFVVLPAAFTGDEILPDAWAEVQVRLTQLRRHGSNVEFAVRSSAVAEDSALASFAGAFETVLNVRSEEEIRTAIDTVRQSQYSQRVKTYSQEQGVPVVHEMAVIVQRLVKADMSGVLFTADPVTSNRTQMVGNYVHGLGDKLVSGEVESANFSMERPKRRYNGPAELEQYSPKLYKLASRLEKDLGCPQDIEWAISRGKVYILQSRPITTMIGFNPVTGEFNDSLTGDFTWSCVNSGEAMPGVMTPFTWSTFSRTYDELNILPGYNSWGNIGGRCYQNSTVMVTLLRARRSNIKDMIKELGGAREEYASELDRVLTPLPGISLFSILPGSLRILMKTRKAMKNLKAFINENPSWCRAQYQRINNIQNNEELATVFMNELMPHILDAFWRTIATAWRHAGLTGKLRRQLTEMVDAIDADALLSNVSSANELLSSLGPVMGLSKVARGEMSRDDYLEQWGHRGPLEADASVPRPFEEPDWLDKQLEAFTKTPIDVENMLSTQRAKFNAAWERLCERHPRRAKKIRRHLDRAAEANRMREAVRSELSRLVWVSRTWALRAGGLTGTGNDIFFLMHDEILELLRGTDTATAYITARRQMYEKYKALPPYPLLIRGRFDPFQWAADPDRSQHFFDSSGLLQEMKLQAPSENVILGMPGSAGRVEGTVRRLDTPDDWDELLPGEILVTSQTNIGWTLIFPRLKAIVTDIGAPLSHAVIVARELGIPAVVNCGDATTRLHTGDRVRVDGTQGTVEILEVS